MRELILTERIPVGKIGGGDDKIVTKLIGHIGQIVVEGAGDKDTLGEPAVDLSPPASAQSFDEPRRPVDARFQKGHPQFGKVVQQGRSEDLLKPVQYVGLADESFSQGVNLRELVEEWPRHAFEHAADGRAGAVAHVHRDGQVLPGGFLVNRPVIAVGQRPVPLDAAREDTGYAAKFFDPANFLNRKIGPAPRHDGDILKAPA